MKNFEITRPLVYLILSLLLASFSGGQHFPAGAAAPLAIPPGGDIGPFVPTPQYHEALGYASDSDVDQANQLLDQIIAQNPGTALAAEAILAKIKIIDDVGGPFAPQIALYDQLTADFSGTRYEIIGKQRLLILQSHNGAEFISGSKDLIQEYGGPPADKVAQEGNTDTFRRQVLYLSLAAKHGLSDAYAGIADELESEHKFREAFNIYHFLREEFPMARFSDGANGYILTDIVHDMRTGTELGMMPGGGEGPPTINPIAPHANLVTSDKTPRIEVELSDGDITHSQVDLSKLVWTLDGQDLTGQMEVGSQINKSGQPGPTFEHLFLTYQPIQPLSKGPHTVYIKVTDYAFFTAENQWTFYIK